MGSPGSRSHNVSLEDQEQMKTLLAKIDRDFHRGRYKSVVRHYENIKKQWPRIALTVGKIALCYYLLGQYEEAVKYLERSFMRENPTPEKLVLLANCYRQMEQYGRALEFYTRAGETTDALFQLGLLHYQTKHFVEALHTFYQVVVRNPDHALSWLKIAQIWSADPEDHLDEAEYYALKAFGIMAGDKKYSPGQFAEVCFDLLHIYELQDRAQAMVMFLEKLEPFKEQLGIHYKQLRRIAEQSGLYRTRLGERDLAKALRTAVQSVVIEKSKLQLQNVRKYFDIGHYFQDEPTPTLAFVSGN